MAGSATITGTQHYIMGIGHPVTEATTEAPPAVFQTDPLTGVSGLTGPDGDPVIKFSGGSLAPYKLAFWGDSRFNSFNGSTAECIGSGTLFTQSRTPMWVVAHMKDSEYARSYAVSGDTAALWNSASRSSGRTFIDLNASDVDAVFIQYGVNDCVAGTPAATIASYLQRLCHEIMKGGKLCIFEAINPVNSGLAGYAAVQVLIDATNALMQTWLSNYPRQALYVDTATSLKDSTGYANPAYYNTDGVHHIRPGAYLSGQLLADACRVLLPSKNCAFLGDDNSAPNIVNLTSPSPITTQFNAVELGSVTISQTSGQDAYGVYYEWSLTPTVLASSQTRSRCELSVNFQTANPPYYSAAINEVLQASALVLLDDGAGGPPAAYNLTLRERFYTGSTFNDWSGNATPTYADPNFTEKLFVRSITPRMKLTANSIVANPSSAGGLQLQCMVEATTLNQLIRLRIYNPQIRRVAYATDTQSVTPPASTVAYTNTSKGNQEVIISGGTVSAIAVNTVSTGLTSGSFTLAPNDTLTPTYTVTPTMLVRQV